jgi:hypothetical protein
VEKDVFSSRSSPFEILREEHTTKKLSKIDMIFFERMDVPDDPRLNHSRMMQFSQYFL